MRSPRRHPSTSTRVGILLAAALLALALGATAVDSSHAQLHERADPHAPIEVASALPSLESAPPALAASFTSRLAALAASATTLVAESLPHALESRLAGIPGTALADPTAAAALQQSLDCAASRGHWVHDPRGARLARDGRGLLVHKQDARYAACDTSFHKARAGTVPDAGEWDVRPSLQWHWQPSPSCGLSSAARAPLPSRVRFCTLLAHKATLVLGDPTQYSLHDLVLDFATTLPQSCYGDLYCKEHALCGEVLRAARDARAATQVESGEEDERVFAEVMRPPALGNTHGPLEARTEEHTHERAHAHAHEERASSSRYTSPTYGTLLRYRRTDGLRPATAHTAPTYRHPSTGVREVNQPWLADARRSDVVLLNKAPLPLPLRRTNASFWEVLDAADAGERAEVLVELAAEWTARIWLPELLDALRAIRTPPSPPDQLVVYRSGWRQHADCALPSAASVAGDGPAPHAAPPALDALLAPDVPLHIAWHNAQLVFQNAVARAQVLPRFGAVYLDLETPLSVWRAGMVGSSAAPSAAAAAGLVLQPVDAPGAGLRSPTSGDCTRYCFPSPGLALETHFLGALTRVFEAGWVGEEGEFEREWVGEGFVGLREREARRAEGTAP